MSTNTLFYAWQSDRPEKINRYLIREALNAAIKLLHAELEVDDALRLDHDTRGVSGTPDIARTILEKIDACAVFVADLTYIASTVPDADEKSVKLVPNPNVLLELGYASKSVGFERIIQVMNTAFGGPNELPFDLRTRRHPVQYSLTSEDQADRKKVTAELAKELKSRIRDILENPTVSSVLAEDNASRSDEIRKRL